MREFFVFVEKSSNSSMFWIIAIMLVSFSIASASSFLIVVGPIERLGTLIILFKLMESIGL